MSSFSLQKTHSFPEVSLSTKIRFPQRVFLWVFHIRKLEQSEKAEGDRDMQYVIEIQGLLATSQWLFKLKDATKISPTFLMCPV